MVERKRRTAATQEPENKTEDTAHDAAAIIIEYERKRKRRSQRKARRKRRDAEKQHHAAMEQMQKSIEVIKWCVLIISAVMTISIIIGIVVLNQVANEAERIKAEVQDIQREAEMIREKIRHPLQSLGGALGSQLEANVSKMLGADE